MPPTNTAPHPPLSPFLTVRQAADEIQVQPKTIYAWIKAQGLPAGKLPGGFEIRIRRTDWDTFLNSMFNSDDLPNASADNVPPPPSGELEIQEECDSRARSTPARRAERGQKRDFFGLGQHASSNQRH